MDRVRRARASEAPRSRPQAPALLAFLLLLSLLPHPVTAIGSALSNVDLRAPLQRAGEVETWTISFDLPETGDLANYKVITYLPDGFEVLEGRSCDIEGATESISVSGLDVTCTILSGHFAPASRLTTHITHVKNPGVEQSTPPFTVKFQNPLGVNVGTANSLSERIDNNRFTRLSAAASDDRAGEVTDWTLRLGAMNAVAGDGDLRLSFPSGFRLAADASCAIAGLGALTLTRVSDTVAECNLNGSPLGAATLYDVTVSKVQNPAWSQASPLLVQSRDAAGKLHDESNATLIVQPHPFMASSATAQDTSPGAVTTWIFSFTTFNPWPADGCLRVTFPAGFILDPASKMTVSHGADGSMASATIQGDSITACREGASPVPSAADVVAQVTNVSNPNTVDPFDALNATLNTLTSDPTALIDENSDTVLGLLPSECEGDCGDGGGIGTPSPPLNLVAALQVGQVRLSWEPPADPGQQVVRNYRIYSATSLSGSWSAVEIGNLTTYSEPAPGPGTKRFYFVRAVSGAGPSNASNVASVQVPATHPSRGPPLVSFAPPSSSVPRVDPLAEGGGSGRPAFPPAALAEAMKNSPARWVVGVLLGLALGAVVGYVAWRKRRGSKPRA